MALVKPTSHRSRDTLFRLCGGPTQEYYSWQRDGHWNEVPDHLLDAALKIRGVKRGPKDTSDLRQCWR